MKATTEPQFAEVSVLVARHAAAIWRYLRLLGADEELAQDLRQDVFLELARSPIRDQGHAATSAYLRRIARHRFIDEMRRHKRRPGEFDAEAFDAKTLDVVDEVWDADQRDQPEDDYLVALRQCLEGLDVDAREIVALRYAQESSFSDMARRLDQSQDAIKSRLQRTKAWLMRCVQRRLGHEA